MALIRSDKITLLKFARKILEGSFQNSSWHNRAHWSEQFLSLFPITENAPAGLFVSLKQSGNLRGCVGTLVAETGLLDTVARMTLQAAFKDPRFKPLAFSELSQIEIEISLLSPMEKIVQVGQIVPHLHGICVKQNLNSGIFLPQVWEQIPDRENFLSELCYTKAGLPLDAWKDPATDIFIFTVDHFREQEINPDRER